MKKSYQRASLAMLLLTLLLLAGCKKNLSADEYTPNADAYFVRFKANGTVANLTIPVSLTQFHDTITVGGKTLHIFTTGGAAPDWQTVALGIYSDKMLAANTLYKESDVLYGTLNGVLFLYTTKGGAMNHMSVGGFDPPGSGFLQFPALARDCIVNMKEVSSTSIRGTFSGTVYGINTSGDVDVSKQVVLSEGEFFLPATF